MRKFRVGYSETGPQDSNIDVSNLLDVFRKPVVHTKGEVSFWPLFQRNKKKKDTSG